MDGARVSSAAIDGDGSDDADGGDDGGGDDEAVTSTVLTTIGVSALDIAHAVAPSVLERVCCTSLVRDPDIYTPIDREMHCVHEFAQRKMEYVRLP